MNTYTLDLAIHSEISERFNQFFRDLGNPLRYDCIVQLWKNKLRFSSTLMPNSKGELGREAIIDASGINLQLLSQFASKFNLAASLSLQERDIFIKIIKDNPEEAILRVIIVSNTLVSQMILDNFFALVDSDLDKNSSR